MGGFLSWRVGNFLPVLLGLWPVIALSGTFAGEAAKGSLDLLASTPQARRPSPSRSWPATSRRSSWPCCCSPSMVGRGGLRKLPGDEIPASAALGQVTLYGVMMLSVGGVAFATGPWVGRTRAMAFGFIVLFASYLIYSYATLSPVIDALKPLSFFTWTAGHRPMAGVSDWRGPALAAVTAVLFAIGVFGFVRRDLGASPMSAGSGCRPCRPDRRPVHAAAGDRTACARVGSRHRAVRRADRGLGRRVQRHYRRSCRRSWRSSRRSTRDST